MRKILPVVILIVLVIATFVLQKSYGEKVVYFPDGTAIAVELATTPEEKSRGLMFRESLEESRGMLFIFERPGYYAFWMKNVRFPLDILWLDENFAIVHIERSVPPCSAEPCASYIPKAPAKYVLEVSANLSQKKGLKAGDKLKVIQFQNKYINARPSHSDECRYKESAEKYSNQRPCT